jgi:hypothetical protein
MTALTRRQTLIGAAATVAAAALPAGAAIAKEDIKEGWYRVRYRKTGDLFDVEVWQISDVNLWVEGAEWGTEAVEHFDFLARIEPPDCAWERDAIAYMKLRNREPDIWVAE